MKTLSTLLISALLTATASAQQVGISGANWAVRFDTRNPANNGPLTYYVLPPPSNQDAFMVFDGDSTNPLPRFAVFDPVFDYAGGAANQTLSIDFTGLNLTDYGLGDVALLSDVDTLEASISEVGFSGDYNDLINLPSIPAAQVNADWSSVSGSSQILNKPVLFSGAYGDLSGVPSTFTPSAHVHAQSDITGLGASLAAKLNTPAGTTAQYLRGDGSLATFPTNLSSFTNGPGYITGINSSMITAALGFTPLSAEVDGSITNEIELPSQTGQSGKVLSTNGTAPSWITPTAFTFSAPSVGQTFTSGTAFQPRAGGPCMISVNGSLTGLVGVNGLATISSSPTSGGTFVQVASAKFLITLLGIGDDKDTTTVPIPAGHWVRITLTGGVTATYTKWDIN